MSEPLSSMRKALNDHAALSAQTRQFDVVQWAVNKRSEPRRLLYSPFLRNSTIVLQFPFVESPLPCEAKSWWDHRWRHLLRRSSWPRGYPASSWLLGSAGDWCGLRENVSWLPRFMKSLCQNSSIVPVPETTDAAWLASFLILALRVASVSTALPSSTLLRLLLRLAREAAAAYRRSSASPGIRRHGDSVKYLASLALFFYVLKGSGWTTWFLISPLALKINKYRRLAFLRSLQ